MQQSPFKVYIDGKLASESPVMRLSQEPWRFDVRIRPKAGSLTLLLRALAVTVQSTLPIWVDAGFVLKR